MRRRFLAFAGGLLVLAGWVSVPRAQAPSAAPCNVTTTERVVAIGDVHGAYDQFVAILRAAGLVNTRDRWSGGRAVLVQTGDIVDRGKDSRKVIELLRRLEREARSAGGQVIALTGNHEFMRLAGDWRYVSAGEYDAFRDGSSNELREAVFARATAAEEERARAEKGPFDAAAYKDQFLREIPLGLIEMRQAFAAGAPYGDWMRARPAVARVNGIVFLHGGISDEVASLGLRGDQRRGGQRHEDAAGRPGSNRGAVLLPGNRPALVSRVGPGAGGRVCAHARLDPQADGRARDRRRPHAVGGAHHVALRRPRGADRLGHARRHVLSRRCPVGAGDRGRRR